MKTERKTLAFVFSNLLAPKSNQGLKAAVLGGRQGSKQSLFVLQLPPAVLVNTSQKHIVD